MNMILIWELCKKYIISELYVAKLPMYPSGQDSSSTMVIINVQKEDRDWI